MICRHHCFPHRVITAIISTFSLSFCVKLLEFCSQTSLATEEASTFLKLSKIFNFKIVKLINVLLFHKFYSQNQVICPGQRREGTSTEWVNYRCSTGRYCGRGRTLVYPVYRSYSVQHNKCGVAINDIMSKYSRIKI